MNFYEAVAKDFVDLALVEGPSKTPEYSLHAALRRALQTEVDWPLIAYRNHKQLTEFVERFYKGLDIAGGGRSDLASLKNPTDSAAVINLMMTASRIVELGVTPKAVARPGLKKIQGSGKYRSVIAAEIAAVAHSRKQDFADAIGDFLWPGISNLEFIERIERSLVEDVDENEIDWSLPKKFSRTAMVWLKSSESSLVSDFCFALFDEWSGVRDAELLGRLNSIHAKRRNLVSG